MRSVILFCQWTAATTAALVLAELTLGILTMAVFGYLLVFTFPLVGGLFFGTAIGVGQWLVLRRRTTDANLWIVATLIGFEAAWIVAMVLALAVFQGFVFVAFAISTPLIGFAQSRVLRRWSSRTWMWITASTVGWSAAAVAIQLLPNAFSTVSRVEGKLITAISNVESSGEMGPALFAGLVAGAITGGALTRIIRTN